MTIEEFQDLLKAKKCLLEDKDLPSALSFSISNKKDKVGVRFYSSTPLEKFNKLNGPWLYFVTVSFDPFKEMGVEVGFSKHKKLKGRGHDEGCVVEISLSKIKKSDEQIIRFGEALAQFIHATFEDKKSAEKNREDYNLNYEAFVRAYAKRRLESGDGLSEGEVKNHAISSTQQEMLPMTNKEVLCALYDKLMNSDDRKSAVEGYKTFCERVSQANEAEDFSSKEWLYENVVYMKGDNGVAPLGQNNQIPERDRLKQDEFFQVLADMLSAAKTPGAEVKYAEWKNCFSAAIKKKNEKAKEQNYVFNRIISAFFPAKVTPIPSAGGFKKIYTWMFVNGFLCDEKKAGDWYGQNKAVMQALDEAFNDRSEVDEYCKGCFAWQLFACLDEGCDPMDLIKGGVPTPGNRELTDEEKMIKEILRANLNLVLTGAPGTGKTFMAKKIARDMTGDAENTPEDHAHIASVQFHPGYDYSDFVIGMKPILVTEEGKEVFRDAHGKLYTTDNNDPNGEPRQYIDGKRTYVSYDWKDGVFKKFAAKAKGDLEHNYVFLIDEINRADLSRVFGELFSLLEEEYRCPNGKGSDFILLPNGERFSIPKNLYIIGTMNDIDRSVESMDFALRRRFAWYEVTADKSEGILDAEDENGIRKITTVDSGLLKEAMKKLNAIIGGEEFKVTDENGSPQNCKLRLGSEYQLGGAIFAKLEKYVKRDSTRRRSPQKADEVAFDKLWNNHIENILLEYLRGQSNRTELVKGLKQVFDDAVKDIDKHGESGRTGDSATVDKNPATDSKSQS